MTQDSTHGLVNMAASASPSIAATTDSMTLGGAHLDTLWRNGMAVTASSTRFQDGFANPLNAITLEPYLSVLTGYSAPGPNANDLNRIRDFMNNAGGMSLASTTDQGLKLPPSYNTTTTPAAPAPNAANINSQFYIFERWTEQSAWDQADTPISYDQAWHQPYVAGDTGLSTETADYFSQLMTAVRAGQPSNMKPILLIPTGEVFDAIDIQLRSEGMDITALNTFLYGDDPLHAHGHFSTFVASTTFFATIFKQNPTGMPITASDFPGLNLDPNNPANDLARINQFESIIWNVVSNNPLTGVPEPTSLGLIALAGIFGMRRSRTHS